MKCPSASPFLGAAAGLFLCVDGAVAAPAVASGAEAVEDRPKAGWLGRLAEGPRKLISREKKAEVPPPPAEPAARPESSGAPAGKKGGAADGKKGGAAASPKTRRAEEKARAGEVGKVAPAPAPVAVEPAKKSFLDRLPSLPLLGRRSEAAAEEETVAAPAAAVKPAALPAGVEKRAGGRDSSKPGVLAAAGPMPAPAEAEAEAEAVRWPRLFELGRHWPGERKADDEVEAVAGGAGEAALSSGGEKPEAGPGRKLVKGEPSAAVGGEVAATEGKPSLWSRVSAAVTAAAPGWKPGPAAQQAPVPVPKGLAGLAMAQPTSDTFVITKDDSPFYNFGPQQATPPDAYLSTGTIVTLTEKSWGWATVRLADGRTGVIDRGALRLATFSDLIPSKRPGGGPASLMAELSPDKLKRRVTPSFVLPPGELPDLPTNTEMTEAAAADAEALSASLLPPFGFNDGPERSDFEPLPDLPPPPPLPTPAADPAPAAEPKTEPDAEPKTEPKTEPDAEPKTEPAPEPGVAPSEGGSAGPGAPPADEGVLPPLPGE